MVDPGAGCPVVHGNPGNAAAETEASATDDLVWLTAPRAKTRS